MTHHDDTIVPTSSMSFEKQVRVLRAYVVLTDFGKKPVHYKEVMKATDMARTQISGLNAFFVGLGLLTLVEKGVYIPTQASVNFYSKNVGEEDFSALQPVVSESLLYRTVKNRILIHGNTSKDEMIRLLLQKSGEKTKSRAERSLQWLEYCGLIEIGDDGNVLLL